MNEPCPSNAPSSPLPAAAPRQQGSELKIKMPKSPTASLLAPQTLLLLLRLPAGTRLGQAKAPRCVGSGATAGQVRGAPGCSKAGTHWGKYPALPSRG